MILNEMRRRVIGIDCRIPALACAFLLSGCATSFAQAPDCYQQFSFTNVSPAPPLLPLPIYPVPGSTPTVDNRGIGCINWTVFYESEGFSAVSLTFQSATGASVAGTLGAYSGTTLSGTNPLTDTVGTGATFNGYVGWWNIALTATGTGSLRGFVYGYRNGFAVPGTTPPGSGCPGTTVTPCVVDGPTATGSPPTTPPVLTAGFDGTNLQSLATDTFGNQKMIGPAAQGASASGNPVRVAGWDGTDIRTLKTDTNGNVDVTGTGIFEVSPTTASNTASNPFFTEISDGTNTANVKAASTQSVAADKSLVIQINPNQPNLSTPLNVAGSGVFEVSPTTAANTASNPFFTEISDGTNTANVKAASTQSVAADKSLVIQINPNQPNLSTALNVALAANQSVNVAQINGNTTSTAANGTQKVGIVGNAAATVDAAPGSAPTNALAVQGVASMTPVEVSPTTTAANTASNPFFMRPGDGTNSMGTLVNFGTIPSAAQYALNANVASFPVPTTSATVAFGAAPYTTNATSTSTYTNVKATAGNFYGVDYNNPNTAVCWLQFYNATAPTVGTSVIFAIPLYSNGTNGAGYQRPPFPVNLSTAISIATTTTATGSTECSTGIGLTLYYQ